MKIKNKQKHLDYLLGRKSAIERGEFFGKDHMRDQKQMTDWFIWIKASKQQQENWRLLWQHYYQEVDTSTVAEMVRVQKKALLENNLLEVKSLSLQIQQMQRNGDLIQVRKPQVPDPFDMENGYTIGVYLDLCKTINRMIQDTDMGIIEGNGEWNEL